MTLAEDRLELSWAATKAIAQAADRAGFEALVPVARWLGLGGPTNFNGINFETYSWAAGLAEATQHITLVTTSHVQTVNPIFAAKQAATIDHISGGRYALNIVCGWFQPELEMFGAPFLSHDDRYDYATEWFEIVRRLWTSEERFSFAGKYFKIDDGFSMPKPLQRPLPPTINAGGSAKGKAFIGEFCDIAFVLLSNPKDFEKSRATIQGYRDVAASHGRTLQVWTHAYVVQRATQEEADRYLHHIGEEVGNEEAASNAAHYLGLNSQIYTPEEWQRFKLHLKAGYGGFADLAAANVTDVLDRELATGALRGIRQQLHWHARPDYRFALRPDVMLDPAWQRGLREVERRGLVFDLQIFPSQFDTALVLVDAFPNLQFVLLHAGMPEDDALEARRAWATGLARLAERPHVAVKLSGLGTFDRACSVERWAPIVHTVTEAFGPDRCLWGSNFPIEKLWTDYATLVRTMRACLVHLDEGDQRRIFHDNAVRIYRIDPTR